MADDEPFDSLGGHGPPVRKSSTTAPTAPPSFAFDHGGNMSTPGMSAAPPATAFSKPSASSVTPDIEDNDELGAIPVRARASEPSIMSTQLNDRWKQYETQMDTHRTESSLEKKTELTEQQDYSSYRLPASARTELAPRQPYSFKKSQSYDTNELIRKYGGMSGVSPMMSSPRKSSFSATSRSGDVRDQAQKMLELVDDHLKTPVDVRRTESGGFRAAPIVDEPYSFNRSTSGSMSVGGKRVPAALAGLDFKSKPASGRYTFSDPKFRDDDHFSDDDEDRIVRGNDGPFEDEPVVDVVALESRAAGSRPYSDGKKFEGDFEGGSKTWSSRYSDSSVYLSQKHVLDKWDKEFDQEQQGRKSARNMFMSTASHIRSSASEVFSVGGGQKQSIFGSGGFSFRANHVFGHHKPADERDGINLRAVWREVDEDTAAIGPPPVHKTWQEVMLNKRKRRRILGGLFIIIMGIIAASAAFVTMKNRKNQEVMLAGANLGKRVTFYVTSDTPTDAASEDKLEKDLINIPSDSDFIIHLGNIQDASVSFCPKPRYGDVASILRKSPVPLLIVPGADDWAKCPDQKASLNQWMDVYKDFDLQFKHALPVKRDIQNPEAFAFLYNGVLFMGLHIVSGPVWDDEEWENRQKEMLKFFFGMANSNKEKFRSIVLLGNARPDAQQKMFFNVMFSNLKDHHAPMVYIHANQHGDEEIMQYTPFGDHKDIQVIGIQDGSSHQPLKITVGFGERAVVIG